MKKPLGLILYPLGLVLSVERKQVILINLHKIDSDYPSEKL